MTIKQSKARKIIKKTGKALAWVFGILLCLVLAFYIAINNPKSQTWMAQRVAAYLSGELKAKVTIRSVSVEFFKKVDLHGIYMEDQHGDTLLYADQLVADLHRFDFNNKYLSVSNITLSDAKVKLKKYRGEKGLSYRFLQKYFQSTDTTSKKNAPWKVDMGGIDLKNVTFAYVDTRDTINDRGMDYENIRVTGIKASFYDIDQMGDSVSLKIKDMQGTERCGLALKDLTSRVTVSDSAVHLDNLHFITAGSAVDGFLSFYFHDRDDFADDFVHLVKMDGHFSNSVIEMGDIAYFSPSLLGIKKKVLLTGDIKGTVDHLKCKNVDILFGESSHLAGNFSFNGLPDINETDMNFRIREAKTNKKDLEGIPVAPFGKGKHLIVDNQIGYLGDMTFTGSFEGFLNDFVAHGTLNTALGSMRMENLAMTRENDTLEYSYVGEVRANHFNIGKFYDISGMSFVTGDVNIKGIGLSKETIKAEIDGNVSELVYRGYAYSGIKVSNGKLRRQVFDGDFNVNDPNVKMIFTGSVDNSGQLPRMNFVARIDSANLGELGFTDKAHESILSTDLNMDFKGNDIDNIEGTFRVNNLNYSKDGEKFRFNEFVVNAGTNADKSRTIFLESDVVTATIKGNYKLMELPHAVSDIMSNYLPSYFPPDKDDPSHKDPEENFTYYIKFNSNTKPIQAIVPKLEIAPGTYFTGSFNSGQNDFNAHFESASIVYKDIAYNGIFIDAGNKATKKYCTLNGKMDEVRLTDTIATKNIHFESIAVNDSIRTKFGWDNKGEKKNDADINALVHFESQKNIQVNFLSTQFHVNDSLWIVSPGNYVRLDSGRIGFHQLVFTSDSASIGLNGFVSRNANDELKISANRFNIAYLNYFTVPHGLTLQGFISSETGLSNLMESPVFTSNTHFDDFYVNGQKLGNGDLTADKIPAKQAVYVKGNFSRGLIDPDSKLPINNVAFDGFYYPKNEENPLDINATFINIPLQTLQPLLKDFCSVMVGQIDGNMHITGTFSKPRLNGLMNVAMRMVRVDYLGLALRSTTQPVTITENSFFFDDYKVMDENGNVASIYGNLYHTNFSKFQFDMDFSFDHFMVLNTTAAQNDQYYGRVFATGYMNVFGYVDDIIHLDMNGTTEKINKNGQVLYSEFNIPMTTGSSEVSSNDFITFVSHDKLPDPKQQKKKKTSGLDISLNVTATQDAIVHVIFDKTVGDELTAYGQGNIQMNVKPSGDFEIRGRYEVEKGKYLFTMKNIVLVPFDLAKGGVISWNGDPYQAQIDADAVYSTPTSVEPFFPNDSVNPAYHRSYPVDVVMHLDGDLMNPGVSFDINLPTADQNIQETVKSYTQTELERNKQVLSLMVLNSFMTPTELRDGNTASTNYSNAGSTLLSNFVSGTLNNWLGQISTDFNMGVVYRPNDDLSTPDLKVFLSTQLLNNRITIDGNLGKVNATQATNTTGNGQWVGDVNVEYKVTDDGKVRLRAFNRSNDNAILTNSALYTQGAGVLYKEEFETWRRLGNKYKEYFFTSKNKSDTATKK